MDINNQTMKNHTPSPVVEHHKEGAGLHLILYSRYNTATDQQYAMSHSNTPPVQK